MVKPRLFRLDPNLILSDASKDQFLDASNEMLSHTHNIRTFNFFDLFYHTEDMLWKNIYMFDMLAMVLRNKLHTFHKVSPVPSKP